MGEVRQITVLDISLEFRKLETTEHALTRMEISDGYYHERAKFVERLKLLFDQDFTILSKDKLLKLIGWQGTYEPIAHFRFVMRCKQLSGRL